MIALWQNKKLSNNHKFSGNLGREKVGKTWINRKKKRKAYI